LRKRGGERGSSRRKQGPGRGLGRLTLAGVREVSFLGKKKKRRKRIVLTELGWGRSKRSLRMGVERTLEGQVVKRESRKPEIKKKQLN